MNTSFALALFAGAVSASAWGYPQYQQQQYSAPAAPQYPQHGGQYGGYQQHQQQPSYHHQQYSAPHYGSYNPWGQPQHYEAPEEPVKPEGWFSVEEQFSPPRIQYKPTKLHETTYASCQWQSFDTETGRVDIAQFPHKAAMIMVTFTGLEVESDYRLTLCTYGALGEDCADVGPEFNPLKELDYDGEPIEYQDLSRGRMNGFTTDVNGDFTGIQETFMQNLGGKDNIIGKSMKLRSLTVGQDEMTGDEIEVVTLIGCCTIGSAPDPAIVVEEEPEVVEEPEEEPEVEEPVHHYGYQQNHYRPTGQHQYRPARPTGPSGPSYGGRSHYSPAPRYNSYGGW